MLLKLSEIEPIEGFNRVATALIRENNLPILSDDDFGRYFPDQVNPAVDYFDFFNKMKILTNTEKFVEKLKNFDRNKCICIYGDYDKKCLIIKKYNHNL